MAQPVKVLATKTHDLRSTPTIHMVGGKSQPAKVGL